MQHNVILKAISELLHSLHHSGTSPRKTIKTTTQARFIPFKDKRVGVQVRSLDNACNI